MTIEIIRIEINVIGVIEENLRIGIYHTLEKESVRDDSGKFRRNTKRVDLEIDRSNPRDKCEERRYQYCRDPGHFMMECQKKKRGQAKKREQRTQMQQISEVVERS